MLIVAKPHALCAAAHPPQITSRYGTEANKAAVDFSVYGPDGKQVHHEEGVSETEIAGGCEGGLSMAWLHWCMELPRSVHINLSAGCVVGLQPARRTWQECVIGKPATTGRRL